MKQHFTLLLLVGLFSYNLTAQAPENDSCQHAIAVMAGDTVAFSTIGATWEGPFHADNPCSTDNDTIYFDIWYVWTAEWDGQAIWSMCGTADFDTRIAVYQPGASCPFGPDDLLACNEDGPGCPGFTSEVVWDVQAGQTYYLRLGGYGGESGTGTFVIEPYVPPAGPPNNDCAQATVITVGEGIEFDNFDATTDGPEHPGNPCFGFGDNTVQADIWYSFTPDFTGTVLWTTCGTVTFDTRLAVYGPDASCPPTDADLLECNDDGPGCPGFSSEMYFDVEAGKTYLLRLGGFNGEQGQGTFDLVEFTPPEPPANDLCENADTAWIITAQQANDFDVTHTGTTEYADFNPDLFLFPVCLGNQAGGEFATVWYKFNSLGNTDIEIRFSAVTSEAQFYVDLWQSCAEMVDTSVITDNCFFVSIEEPFVVDTFSNLPPEPTEFYLRVTTRLTTDLPGEFFFQLVGDITTGVEDRVFPGRLLVAPNPAADFVNVYLNLEEAKEVQYRLVDALGRQKWHLPKGRLPAGEYSERIALQDLPQGVYFLLVEADGALKTQRIVKH